MPSIMPVEGLTLLAVGARNLFCAICVKYRCDSLLVLIELELTSFLILENICCLLLYVLVRIEQTLSLLVVMYFFSECLRCGF